MHRPRLVYVVTYPVTTAWPLRDQLGSPWRQGFDVSVVAAPAELLDKVAERERNTTVDVPMARGSDHQRDLTALAGLAPRGSPLPVAEAHDERPHVGRASHG